MRIVGLPLTVGVVVAGACLVLNAIGWLVPVVAIAGFFCWLVGAAVLLFFHGWTHVE